MNTKRQRRACPFVPDEVRDALAKAARGPGWNNRRRDSRRFTVPGFYGNGCTLYVVPAAAWAFRRFDPVTGDNVWLRDHADVLGRPFGIAPDNAA